MTTPVEPRIDVVLIDLPETAGDVIHSFLPIHTPRWPLRGFRRRCWDSGAPRTSAQIELRYVKHLQRGWTSPEARVGRSPWASFRSAREAILAVVALTGQLPQAGGEVVRSCNRLHRSVIQDTVYCTGSHDRQV